MGNDNPSSRQHKVMTQVAGRFSSCVSAAVNVGVWRCWSASGVQRHESLVAAVLLLSAILFHSEIDRSQIARSQMFGDRRLEIRRQWVGGSSRAPGETVEEVRAEVDR